MPKTAAQRVKEYRQRCAAACIKVPRAPPLTSTERSRLRRARLRGDAKKKPPLTSRERGRLYRERCRNKANETANRTIPEISNEELRMEPVEEEPWLDADSRPGSSPGLSDIKKGDDITQDIFTAQGSMLLVKDHFLDPHSYLNEPETVFSLCDINKEDSTVQDTLTIEKSQDQSSAISMDFSEASSIDPVSTCDEHTNVKLEDNKQSVLFLPEVMEHKGSSEENEADPLETDIEENTRFIKVEKDAESAVCSNETAMEFDMVLIKEEPHSDSDEPETSLSLSETNKEDSTVQDTLTVESTEIKTRRSRDEMFIEKNHSSLNFNTNSMVLIKKVDLSTDQKHICQSSYMCDICKKTFKDKVNLQKHQVVHTKERPFVCDICNKTYSHGQSLKARRFVNSSERCIICNKSFSLKSILPARERPVMCDI